MGRLERIAGLIAYLGILNFVLFIVISLLLGGDGLNGKVEADRYYLGNHGFYTEVPYLIYLYSRLHAITVCITWPLVMLAGAAVRLSPQTELESIAWELGRVYEIVETIFWRLFDSWRKPDLELFTRFSILECGESLLGLIEFQPIGRRFGKAVHLRLGKSHFNINWHRSTLVLHGKLTATPHGTFVRVWHRFSILTLLILMILIGIIISSLIVLVVWLFTLIAALAGGAVIWGSEQLIRSRVLFMLSSFAGLWIAIQLGSRLGRRQNKDLTDILKETLMRERYPSSVNSVGLIQRLGYKQTSNAFDDNG